MDTYTPTQMTERFDAAAERQLSQLLRRHRSWPNGWAKREALRIADEGIDCIVERGALNQMLDRIDGDTVVYSIVSQEYLNMGVNWVRYYLKLGLNNCILICADEKSQRFFSQAGLMTVLARLPFPKQDEGRTSTGFTQRGILITTLKFPVASHFLEAGYNVVFSDIDALWLRDPLPIILSNEADLSFQSIYKFPEPIIRWWGFGLCSGFFHVRCTDPIKHLLGEAHQLVKEVMSDQLALNIALLERSIQWNYPDPDLLLTLPPKGGSEKRQLRTVGLLNSVLGQSRSGDLRVCALPHVNFLRHTWLIQPTAETCVFHPNSPKKENGKLRVFRSNGFEMETASTQ